MVSSPTRSWYLTAAVIMSPLLIHQSPNYSNICSIVPLSSPPPPSLSSTSLFHIISQLPSAVSFSSPSHTPKILCLTPVKQNQKETHRHRDINDTPKERRFVLTGVAQQWALNLQAERVGRDGDTEMEKGERCGSWVSLPVCARLLASRAWV